MQTTLKGASQWNRAPGEGVPSITGKWVHSAVRQLLFFADVGQLPTHPDLRTDTPGSQPALFIEDIVSMYKGASQLNSQALPGLLNKPPKHMLMAMGLPYTAGWAANTPPDEVDTTKEHWKTTGSMLLLLIRGADEALPLLLSLVQSPQPTPPVVHLKDLLDEEPAFWASAVSTTALPVSCQILVGTAGPWLAIEIAQTLLRDPSLLLNAVTCHLLLAATSCQLAAVYGPPGTGKTRLLIYLTTLFLAATKGTHICWASAGNTTISSTATDFAALLPARCHLAHQIARVVSNKAEDLAPSPFDATNAQETKGKRLVILTTGVLAISTFTFYLYLQISHWVIADEAQQLLLARDLLVALLGIKGAVFTCAGDPKQPHLIADDDLKQLRAKKWRRSALLGSFLRTWTSSPRMSGARRLPPSCALMSSPTGRSWQEST